MNTVITALYSQLAFLKIDDVPARIDFFTEYFLGKPYIINPQGEGGHDEIDQSPLYRFDGFDCVTYVNNLLALALSEDIYSFQEKLLQINYYHSKATFENRFHFMSLDWNIQNQNNNIVVDITEKIIDKNNTPICLFAEGDIDRPNWFLKRAENQSEKQAQRLIEISKTVKKEFARLPYLPLSVLFDENKNPRDNFFNQIPHACVIEIVRPNWNLKDKIGTQLHVSHVGFAVRNASGELYFRHASSEQNCVVEILLADYLSNFLESSTIKGINIQLIL